MMQTIAEVDSARVIVAAHHAYTLWGLIAVVIFEAGAIVLLLIHRGWGWIATAPLTNIRLLNGIVMFSLFNLSVVVVGYATGSYPPVDVILAIDGAILLMAGLDVTMYGVKRWTTDPAIQSNQNVQSGITPGPPTTPPAPAPPPSTDPPPIDPVPVPAPLPVPVPVTPPVPTASVQAATPAGALAGHRYTAGD